MMKNNLNQNSKPVRSGENFVYKLDNKLYLNLTNECCCSCDFCLRKLGDGVAESTLWLRRSPTEADVLSQIAAIEAEDFEYSEAIFCGYGEPTYEAELMAVLAKKLKEKGKIVRLNTNGLGNQINGKDIVLSLKGVVDEISISLNAPDAVQYQQNCHCAYGAESFDFILEFTKLCIKAEIKTILTVLDILPVSEIEKCRAIAKKLRTEFRVRKFVADNYNYERKSGGKS